MSITIWRRMKVPSTAFGLLLQAISISLKTSLMLAMKLPKLAATPTSHTQSSVNRGSFGGISAMLIFSFVGPLLFLSDSDLRVLCCWSARAKADVPSPMAFALLLLLPLLQLISPLWLWACFPMSVVVAALERRGSLATSAAAARLPATTAPFRRFFSVGGAVAVAATADGDAAARAWACTCSASTSCGAGNDRLPAMVHPGSMVLPVTSLPVASTDLAIASWSAATAGNGGGGGADDGGGPSPRLAAGLVGKMPVNGDVVWADLQVVLLSSSTSSSSSSSAPSLSSPSSPDKWKCTFLSPTVLRLRR
mmetsp:Transcript_58382/g.148039  ORF Transcript_58382/g.148039 Transcript_58382/m.148039 type:complete len:308 (-) Transcript_58382:240-1163(-)